MILFPNAKINLGLYVTERRKDGYHNLITCMVPVGWKDVLEIIDAQKFTYSSSGIEVPGNEKDNLCVKAYKLLNKDFNLPPVHIHLHKEIPMGAGLGGGSADAAFTLKALNQHFELYLDDSLLEDYAAQLGSDCAFFIRNKSAMATGRGELLEVIDLNLTGKFIVLVNPVIHVSTAQAYAGIHPSSPPIDLKSVLLHEPLEKWKSLLQNDFEKNIFLMHPEIAAIKEELYTRGASFAAMSGSGASVFGIFDHAPTSISFPDHYMIWRGDLAI